MVASVKLMLHQVNWPIGHFGASHVFRYTQHHIILVVNPTGSSSIFPLCGWFSEISEPFLQGYSPIFRAISAAPGMLLPPSLQALKAQLGLDEKASDEGGLNDPSGQKMGWFTMVDLW